VSVPSRDTVLATNRSSRVNHRPQKTAMLLAQRIVGDISDRNLAPGSALLSEADMLNEFGVARGTLREALRFLEIQGVISIKTGPGGGPVVSESSSRQLASIIALLLQLNGTPFRMIVDARLLLEPAMARKAAERITDEVLELLEKSVKRMKDEIEDREVFLEENEYFHSAVALAANNPLFVLIVESLAWICDGTPLGVDYPLKARQVVVRAHQRILESLRARDGDRAAAAMAVHLGDFLTYMERNYPQIMDKPLRWDQLQW
jgi:DNA-binding FadR family transcriptional regulator